MDYTLEQSPYHKTLRVMALVTAVIVAFESGLFSSATARLTNQTELYLANAVGVYVGVPQNDVNRLTSRIAELEQQVGSQSERELALGLGGVPVPDRSTFVLSGILFIMLVLIVLNYALDYARGREKEKYTQLQGAA